MKRRTSDSHLLNKVLALIYNVADKTGTDANYLSILTNSEKKIEITIPLVLDDGTIKPIKAFRIQHTSLTGPSIGSISMVKNFTEDDCEALAMIMSLHNSMLNLPLGGSKGIIQADPKDFSKSELERLYKSYVKIITDLLDNKHDIIKLNESNVENSAYYIMSEIERKFSSLKSVVNRPDDFYGTGLAYKLQSYSVAYCVHDVLKKFCKKDISEVTLGITLDENNPDVNLLFELHKMGLKIEGFNVENGKNICETKIWDIIHNFPWDFDTSIKVKDCDPTGQSEDESILTSEVDVLILQNDKYRITSDIAEKIKAKYIIEAEENLISSDAEAILEDRGIIIIPDFISLSGALINSYVEWINDTASSLLTEEECKRIISILIHHSLEKIWEIKESSLLTTNEAALKLAIDRLILKIEKSGAI